ncbi:hypothetical protein GCM10027194_31730 [Thalassiella azotivora]
MPTVGDPLPGSVPGDPAAPDVEDTYPWMSTDVDLLRAGYTEREHLVTGSADAYGPTGELLDEDVDYTTRVVVRRPIGAARFNGTVLVEWQNVTAGYDLDALWNPEQLVREGYAWVGVSVQRVGVDHLRTWSPARYAGLDVTGGGAFVADELSYDVYAQVGQALQADDASGLLGRLRLRTVLGVGASQSAARMTTYHDHVLRQTEEVFDGFSFVVGPAPSRPGRAPVVHVLSETDVRTPVRRPDDDGYCRWEVTGAAHSGWNGQEYRRSILTRDLGAAPTYECARPPFSRVPLHHVLVASYGHLARWALGGAPPPSAPVLELADDGTKVRDALGHARGGTACRRSPCPRRWTPATTPGRRSASCSAATSRSTTTGSATCTPRTAATCRGSWPPTARTCVPATSCRGTRRRTCGRPSARGRVADGPGDRGQGSLGNPLGRSRPGGYHGCTGVDPAITGEPPEEQVAPGRPQ